MIVAHGLSNYPTDRNEALPTLEAIAPDVGTPEAAALDTVYFSATHVAEIGYVSYDAFNS